MLYTLNRPACRRQYARGRFLQPLPTWSTPNLKQSLKHASHRGTRAGRAALSVLARQAGAMASVRLILDAHECTRQPSAPFPQLQHHHATHNNLFNAVQLQRPNQQPQNPIEGELQLLEVASSKNPPRRRKAAGWAKNALLDSSQNRTLLHEAQALLLSPEGPH